MIVSFTKYQGTGNDFILIDNRNQFFSLSKQHIQKLTDRRFGIGADGLMLIENEGTSDFKMTYFNADGSQSLCGNGSRCAVDFARSLGLINDSTSFLTTDGIHKAHFEDGNIHFQLYDVSEVEIINKNEIFIHTGSPHHMVFVKNVDEVDIIKEGAAIRNSEKYPKGTNVNFVQINRDDIKVRTYERGVENETLSCGTGVTAAAIASTKFGVKSPVHVKTLGGSLIVTFDQKSASEFKNIYLAGPATKVFEGKIEI